MLASSPLPGPETVVLDTLSEAVLVSSYKQVLSLGKVASPVTEVRLEDMEARGLDDFKKLSLIVPNLHIPDYGSSMTSTFTNHHARARLGCLSKIEKRMSRSR